MVPSLLILSTLGSSGQDVSVTNAYCTSRWLVRGLGAELATNLAGRGRKRWRHTLRAGGGRTPPPSDGALAVVTGATGGLGAEICAGLASLGYDVVVAGRDPRRGEALASRLRASGASASYVRWEATDLASAHAVARAAGGRPCALLVNNAGVMGRAVSKAETVRTNLLAPAALTLALLPALRRHGSPRVVNVGSSSHLRARRVAAATLESPRSDANLLAYAQSKLGLMQLSLLLRASLPWLTVVDAHPGIVWTPMLQAQAGGLAAALQASGAARLLFKSPEAGATTVLTAAVAPRVPPPSWGERARWRRGWRRGPYFVNCRPGGFASAQSRDLQLAREMWSAIVAPAVEPVVRSGCREVEAGSGQGQGVKGGD